MLNYSPDVIGVTETWATDDILDSELALVRYDMFRQDRPVNRAGAGGGVLLYVKNSLQAIVYEPSVSFPEQIWCKISCPSADTIHIGVCYRTPNGDIFGTDNHDTIRSLLNEMGTGKHHFVLMGDFNYSIVHWPPLHENSYSLDTRQFYDCLDDNFFSQHMSAFRLGKIRY